jgi:hypothetical protein
MPDGTDKIPAVIAIRTESFTPLLAKWRDQHRGVPWSELLRRGLKKELREIAGKRLAHLVDAA